MRRLVLKVVLLGLLSSVLFAQPPADPSFEVASVKSNRTEAPATTLFPLGPGDAYAANGGRFRATNQPLITYLRFAYRLGQGDLLDLPRWVYNERFDIEARANGEPAKDQMRVMMRSLLKDRFKLVVHTEQRTQAIFDLELATPGRTGPQLRAHQTDETCVSPSNHSSRRYRRLNPLVDHHRSSSCRRFRAAAEASSRSVGATAYGSWGTASQWIESQKLSRSRSLASIATSAIEQASAGHSICHWSGRWCRIQSRRRSLCRTTCRRGFWKP